MIILSTVPNAYSSQFVPFGLLTDVTWQPENSYLVGYENDSTYVFELSVRPSDGVEYIQFVSAFRDVSITAQSWNLNGSSYTSADINGQLQMWNPVVEKMFAIIIFQLSILLKQEILRT